jgi:hypothetical protein
MAVWWLVRVKVRPESSGVRCKVWFAKPEREEQKQNDLECYIASSMQHVLCVYCLLAHTKEHTRVYVETQKAL